MVPCYYYLFMVLFLCAANGLTHIEGGCRLNTTRDHLEWCKIPGGVESITSDGDMASFPTATRCALRTDIFSVVCMGCYNNQWDDTSCTKDLYKRRQKRFIEWIAEKAQEVTCWIASCGGGAQEEYKPPSITCKQPNANVYYAGRGAKTAYVYWSTPTGKDGNGNSISVSVTGNNPGPGSYFPRGNYVITYTATDSRTTKSCAVRFEVRVHVCNPISTPTNGRKDCGIGEIIWGRQCKLTCNIGYNLIGNGLLTCMRYRQYDKRPGTCRIKTCPILQTPQYSNGYQCTSGWNYRSTCRITCRDGFSLTQSYTRCTDKGTWSLPVPTCKDVTDPVFSDCSSKSKLVYTELGETSTIIFYTPPIVTDNSRVTVTRIQGPSSGSTFGDGTHVIKYMASDQGGNKAYCSFTITVRVVRCRAYEPGRNMTISCDSTGLKCDVFCPNGYILKGPNKIACIKNNSFPPTATWDVASSTKPSCIYDACKLPIVPGNGALAYTHVTGGKLLSFFCQSNYNTQRVLETPNLLVCGAKGNWVPLMSMDVHCKEIRGTYRINLPSELQSFSGNCSANTDAIKGNFMKILKDSHFHHSLCSTPGDCVEENVNVVCDLSVA